MKEQLEKLIRTVEETQLVKRLMAAKDTAERVKICKEAEKTPEFEAFMERYGEVVENQPVDVDYMVSADEFTCTKENAVAVAVIFIIEGIDDVDMFDECGLDRFFDALENVEGEQKEVAAQILKLLGTDIGCDGLCITDFDLDGILGRIF